MDKAFVKDSQHEINHQHGHDEEQTQTLETGLEGGGFALEGSGDPIWKDPADCLIDLADGISQGNPSAGIER